MHYNRHISIYSRVQVCYSGKSLNKKIPGYNQVSEEEMYMNRYRSCLLFSVLNIIGYLGVITVNALANVLPINGVTTGELSDRYPNLFVPAGITFSIWGVIYILLAIFVVYQLVSVLKKDPERYDFTERTGILFFISCIANAGWIFAWHYTKVPLSLVLMLILLVSLILIYVRLGTGKRDTSKKEKFMIFLPFSIYLGWITVATIANITAFQVDAGWSSTPPGEQFWTVVVIVVAIAIALAVLVTRKDIFFALVIDWALAGILIKRLDVSEITAQSVIIASIAGLILITFGILVWLIRKKVY